MRQESARTKKVGRTLSAEKMPSHLAKAHGSATTSASGESPLPSPHVPEREPKVHVIPPQPKIALEARQALDASVHKPTGVAIPKLVLKTAPVCDDVLACCFLFREFVLSVAFGRWPSSSRLADYH
jgi:hypothetical protein